MNAQQTKQKGFTIIEVVLVLAIAGLIFLMVFIALPALQRNQRDTARKSDVSAVSAAVNGFVSTNRGKFPTTAQLEAQVGASGVGANKVYKDLSNNVLDTVVVNTSPAVAGAYVIPDGTITVYKGLKCDTVTASGSVTLVVGTARQYATTTRLEGGNDSGYCLDT